MGYFWGYIGVMLGVYWLYSGVIFVVYGFYRGDILGFGISCHEGGRDDAGTAINPAFHLHADSTCTRQIITIGSARAC